MDWLKVASTCPVLSGVEPDRLEQVLNSVKYKIKRYKKGDIVASQGDEVKSLLILLTGSVRGEMTDYSGRMIKIEDIYAPKPIAGAFLFGNHNRYPVDIHTNEDCTMLLIYREDFLRLLHDCPAIQVNYLNLISTKAQFLSNKIQFLSFKNLRGKIAHYLLNLNADDDGYLHIPESQQALSELFGVARPSVARGFKQYEDEGVLEVKNRKVMILKPAVLTQYLLE